MAEETPGNLGSMFGGWAAGRAAGNSRLDKSVDRLEAQIARLTEAMERLSGAMATSSRTAGGGGATQQAAPGRANGGGATFGGAHAGDPRGTLREAWGALRPTGGAHAGPPPGQHSSGQASWGPRPSGGAHSNGGGVTFGGVAGGAARVAGGAAVGAAAIYTMNHYSGSHIASTLAGTYTNAGTDPIAAAQRGFYGNATAHNAQDHWGAITQMGRMSGFGVGTQQWNESMRSIRAVSAVNPEISNTQSAAASFALATPGAYNQMRAMGINSVGKNGIGDPGSVARQLVQRIGGHRFKTAEQVAAAFGPAGSATTTVNSFVSSGMMPAESAEAVLGEMRRIMMAQTQGMGYQEYRKNRFAATSTTEAGEAARARLQDVGVSADTHEQRDRALEGNKRDREGVTLEGFDKGVRGATEALDEFQDAINSFLKLPVIKDIVGITSGAAGKIPIIGSALNAIPGVGGLLKSFGGDGPSSLSSSNTPYGAASGAAAARAGMSGGAGGGGGGGGGSTGMGAGAASKRYNLGPVKPWVAQAAGVLGSKFGIGTVYGFGQRSGASDHPKGLALDFMCGKSAGDGLAAYAVRNHKALNITYVIWRQRIWSINNPSWKQMEDRGSVTANHYDHVHISFLASPTNRDMSGLGGGGLGAGVGGGGGRGAGANSPDNGSSAAFAGGGGTSGIGYTEVAALGLGAGGGAGGMGMSDGVSSSSGGGGGVGGGMGGRGPAGSARVGAYNVLNSTSNAATQDDLRKIMGRVDALGLGEMVGDKNRLGGWLREQGWGYYKARGRAADAALAWDKDDYTALRTGSRALNPNTQGKGGLRNRFAAYALLQDKESGAKFWQISAHTVPRGTKGGLEGAIMREQYQNLARLREELGRTGIPVVITGDLNNRNPNIRGMGNSKFGGLDHILGGAGATIGKSGSTRSGMSSDHPFVWANVGLPGSKQGGRVTGNGGTPAQNMALGKQMAANWGWTGNQWEALRQLWMQESGWRTNADNPSSSAYGIPQALTATHGLGADYMRDPRVQIRWGLNYIKGRYGSPAAAWNFHQRNNWYAMGEWDIRDDKDARVHKGEMILPSKVAEAVRDSLTSPGIRDALGSGRGSGMQINFEKGAIQISLPGSVSKSRAREVGTWVVDAMMEDDRLKTLAEG